MKVGDLFGVKILELRILEEIFHNGPGYRMDLWRRCGRSPEWPEFKKTFYMLHAQNMVCWVDRAELITGLTAKGRVPVYELLANFIR